MSPQGEADVRATLQLADAQAPARTGSGYRDARVVGWLNIGFPDDSRGEGHLLQDGFTSVDLIVSGDAWLGSTVPFRHLDDPGARALRAMRELLVRRVLERARIAMEEGSALAGGDHEEMLRSEELAALADARGKQCAFQTPSAPGLFCTADRDGLGRTSTPICAACQLPDDRLRCTALVHPVVSELETMGHIARSPSSALCDAGHQDRVGDTSGCVAGGNGCWHKDLVLSASSAGIDPDAPRRLIDELKHLRLALGEAFQTKLSRGSDELGVGANLVSDCDSAQDLEGKIMAVGSLLEPMNLAKSANAMGATVEGGKGSLVAMREALDWLKAVGHEAPIEVLRSLQAVRSLLAHDNWTAGSLHCVVSASLSRSRIIRRPGFG